ncbi:MAG: FMN-binding protein, partial [Oscillospiraceae bacterium]
MKKSKKILALVLCLSIMGSMFAGCTGKNGGEAAFKAGKYQGEADGYGGKIVVEVEVDDNKILGVTVLEHKESAGVSDPALEKIPAAIVDGQSLS